MPELPELEVLCEVLSDRVVGRTIRGVAVLHPGLLKTVTPAPDDLAGTSFGEISRRGKHLIFKTDSELYAVLHLMLAGRLVLSRSDTKHTKATACAISFEGDEDLRVIENTSIHRARLHIVRDPADVPSIARAGVEPLSEAFTLDELTKHVMGPKRQLKKLLTDQTIIAGIGSAYADEILFDAQLSPIRYGPTLDAEEIERLYESVRSVLRESIDEIRKLAGGATLAPHDRPFARVYKRTGLPCVRCGTPIAEIRYAQTKTYYCPSCQSGGKTIKDRRSWLTR